MCCVQEKIVLLISIVSIKHLPNVSKPHNTLVCGTKLTLKTYNCLIFLGFFVAANNLTTVSSNDHQCSLCLDASVEHF
jgi:hypothetical protein